MDEPWRTELVLAEEQFEEWSQKYADDKEAGRIVVTNTTKKYDKGGETFVYIVYFVYFVRCSPHHSHEPPSRTTSTAPVSFCCSSRTHQSLTVLNRARLRVCASVKRLCEVRRPRIHRERVQTNESERGTQTPREQRTDDLERERMTFGRR